MRTGNILRVALQATAGAIIVLGAGALLLLTTPALPHQATPTAAKPQGWSYPINCCSSVDCRQIPGSWVKTTPDGYRLPNGNVVAYSDHRKKDSPDGEYHWCTIGGTFQGGTICLFVPPPGA